MKKRLDVFLYENGFADTRSKATQLIKGGYVFVDAKPCKKSGMQVDEHSKIEIKESPFIYVSRAGIKLKSALERFKMDLRNKICLDVGASTGGFSDCMLKEGAKEVYAVDVGSNQLHKSLKSNKNVFVFENTDIRHFQTAVKFDFVAVDVSFISLEHILPYIKNFMKKDATAIVLIKPQFEVGPHIVKKGIVKDETAIKNVIRNIKELCKNIGLKDCGLIESPIKGKEGNKEYLMLLKKS